MLLAFGVAQDMQAAWRDLIAGIQRTAFWQKVKTLPHAGARDCSLAAGTAGHHEMPQAQECTGASRYGMNDAEIIRVSPRDTQ